MKNQYMIYGAVGVAIFLILVSSTKKVALEEVSEPSSLKSFDSSVLPIDLKPPLRLPDGEPLPKNMAKRNLSFNSSAFKPRFDDFRSSHQI